MYMNQLTMNAYAPTVPVDPAPSSSNGITWVLAILVFVGIYLLLRPYLPLLAKVVELFRLLLNKTNDLSKTPEAFIGKKLVENKEKKESPQGYCYMGEFNGTRHCVEVEKSRCSSGTYSTESQCVNPTL
jgi:hypothetical protein